MAVNGQIKITGNGILHDHEALAKELQSDAGIAAVSPYAEGVVLITHGDDRAYPVVRGFDSMNPDPVVPMQTFMRKGAVADLVDWTVVIGDKLAQRIHVDVGDTINLYTPLIMDRLKHGEVLLPEALEVVGIFSTGYTTVDENYIVVTLRKMQDLYALNDGVHGLSVRLHDQADMVAVANELNDRFESKLRAHTWLDENNDIYTALKTHKAMMYFILIAISVVAAFAIAISLSTTVLRKTKEIGIYSAIGATRRHVALVFSLQGLFIGIVGTALGIASAYTFLHFRNEILSVFASFTGSRDILVHFYQFETLPVHYSAVDITIIIAAGITISTLAGLLPAWRAASLKPSEALRNG